MRNEDLVKSYGPAWVMTGLTVLWFVILAHSRRLSNPECNVTRHWGKHLLTRTSIRTHNILITTIIMPSGLPICVYIPNRRRQETDIFS